MKTMLVLLSLLLLSACNSAVQLRHVATGKTVQCGPYSAFSMSSRFSAVERERGCIQDFQRQGYERVMN